VPREIVFCGCQSDIKPSESKRRRANLRSPAGSWRPSASDVEIGWGDTQERCAWNIWE
jgi:hypothetical protein